MTPTRASSARTKDVRPLKDVRVLVTRSAEQAPELSRLLRRLGAVPIEAPAIRVVAPVSWSRVDRALAQLEQRSYEWIVLTSSNGVRFLFERLDALGVGSEVFRSVRVAAVGSGTAAALKRRGVRAALVPDTFTTRAVGRAFPKGKGKVLLARADVTEPGLEEAIERLGWTPERLILYRLQPEARLEPPVRAMLREDAIDIVTFASGGTVRAFVRLLRRPLPRSVRVACIGPVTARVAREKGIRVDAIADEHTISGLASATVAAWAAKPRQAPR